MSDFLLSIYDTYPYLTRQVNLLLQCASLNVIREHVLNVENFKSLMTKAEKTMHASLERDKPETSFPLRLPLLKPSVRWACVPAYVPDLQRCLVKVATLKCF
jgi:hypothetical protein